MIKHLSQPEYMHVLLNPLPIYGLSMGVLALVIALVWRARPARVTAFAIIFLSSLSVWPVSYYGDSGYDRIQAVADDDGIKWLDQHVHRAQKLIPLYYALAALSIVVTVLEFAAPRAAAKTGIALLLLAIVTLGGGAYIAYPGGRVRHREFRFEPAPTKPHETTPDETPEQKDASLTANSKRAMGNIPKIGLGI